MKSFSQILLLSFLSLAAFVACKPKSSGGESSPPAPVCLATQVMQPNQYCNGGTLTTAQPCNPAQATPPGFMCMNGYLIPTGINGSGNLLSNVQFANSSMQGVANFSGSGNADWSNPSVAYFYAGPISISGVVQVTNGSLCGAPVGSYSISGQGSYSAGTIYNMMLTISGPSQMQLMVSNAILDNPQEGLIQGSSNNRLGIMVSSLIVNGMPCGPITTY